MKRTLKSAPLSKKDNQHATLIGSTGFLYGGKCALILMSHHTQKNQLQTDHRYKYERKKKRSHDLEVGSTFLSRSQN